MANQEIINRLLLAAELETDEDFEELENVTKEIICTSDKNAIPYLFQAFKGKDGEEIEWCLVRALDSFPYKLTASEFMKQAEEFCQRDSNWFELYLRRFLNAKDINQKAFNAFCDAYHEASFESKKFILRWIEKLSKETPNYMNILDIVKKGMSR